MNSLNSSGTDKIIEKMIKYYIGDNTYVTPLL